jgi:hypothetical protein
MRGIAIALTLFFTMSAPARAEHADDPFSAAAGTFVRGLVQEEDVTLFFGYLREALSAAAEGRDAPVPDVLSRRAEEIGERAKQRGIIAGRVLLDAVEASVRDMLGDRSRTPQGF